MRQPLIYRDSAGGVAHNGSDSHAWKRRLLTRGAETTSQSQSVGGNAMLTVTGDLPRVAHTVYGKDKITNARLLLADEFRFLATV